MNELPRDAIIVISIFFGIMGCCLCFNLVYFIIRDVKDRKKKPKIEDLQRQLAQSEHEYDKLCESFYRSSDEHKALALAVMLCKNNNLNLKQLEELGLQRYNALQTRHNFISNEAYEELVKNYIICPKERYERRR